MYPEHVKLAKCQGEIDLLGKFIDWFRKPNNRFHICCHQTGFEGGWPAGWFPDYSSNERLIYLYLGIDPATLERERREMQESRHVPTAKIDGIVHRIKEKIAGVFTGCDLPVNAYDIMVCLQRPEDITCQDPGCKGGNGDHR